jgi:hypothetical protein
MMDPVVDYFEWIYEVRREPVGLWFWADDEPHNPVYDELEKEMSELIGREQC